MNKKETTQALEKLDACIDGALLPELLTALDALRTTLLQQWQQDHCSQLETENLLTALEDLPPLCSGAEKHPSLLTKLSQVMYALCAPAVEPGQDLGNQCRRQAEKIRRLRQWQEALSPLAALYEEESRRELEVMHAEELQLMSDVFTHLLLMYRAGMYRAAAALYQARLEELESCRALCDAEEVSALQEESRTLSDATKEKFSDFAADISAGALLTPVKEVQQSLQEAAPEADALPEVTEEG